MNESNGYAVFFFPQALEALGEAVKPYLQDSPAGAHVLCNEIDTGGALVEMTLRGRDTKNRDLALELMVPVSMVRMVVSTHSDESFGFGPQVAVSPEPVVAADVAKTAAAQPTPVAPAPPPASMPAPAEAPEASGASGDVKAPKP
jgi:hypothetical protein